MSSRGVQAPTEGRSMSMRPQTGEQVRDGFHRRLDQHMGEAVDAFRAIVESCQIQDRVASLQRDFAGEVDSANLCRAAEDMLRLISDLKVATIVQEVSDTKQETMDLRSIYDKEVKATDLMISSLVVNLHPTLDALEHHYYHSATTWGVKERKDSEGCAANKVSDKMTDD